MEFGGIPRTLHSHLPGCYQFNSHVTQGSLLFARHRVFAPVPLPPQTCSHMLTTCLAQERAAGVKIPDFLGLLITFQVSIAVEHSQPMLSGIKQPPFNTSMGQESRQDTGWVTYLCSVMSGAPAGRLERLRLESSAASSTHLPGAPAGMTPNPGSFGTDHPSIYVSFSMWPGRPHSMVASV